ncbi:MAG: aromatic amino acid transport family protein [Candidatus Pacearchaeota archaeon]
MDSVNKKFWVATFTLTGTVIGAGILGLPYVFSRSGFIIGIFWIIFLSAIIILTKLYLGEVVLRTKGVHQMTGYAEKYLGKWGKIVMLLEMTISIYLALLAYLIGEGQSLSQLFTGGQEYSVYFALGFWFIMTLLLKEGLKGMKKVESWGVLAIILIIFGMTIYYFPGINYGNISYFDYGNFFLPFGVVLFALFGFSAIPEIKRELGKDVRLMKKTIFTGAMIPAILYIIFGFIFINIFGKDVPEIATLAFGNFVVVLGVFTMLTSYFVLSFVMRDMLVYDLKIGKIPTFVFVSLLPLILYLILFYFNLLGFVSVLGIGGIFSATLTSILVLIMNKQAKKFGNRRPEYSIPISWFIIILISLVFIIGTIVELFF